MAPSSEITKDEAEFRFMQDISELEKQIEALVQVRLTENEFSALVSLCYNIGISAFERSTLLKKLNLGDKVQAAEEFLRWTYVGKQSLPGLVERRKQEKALFVTG